MQRAQKPAKRSRSLRIPSDGRHQLPKYRPNNSSNSTLLNRVKRAMRKIRRARKSENIPDHPAIPAAPEQRKRMFDADRVIPNDRPDEIAGHSRLARLICRRPQRRQAPIHLPRRPNLSLVPLPAKRRITTHDSSNTSTLIREQGRHLGLARSLVLLPPLDRGKRRSSIGILIRPSVLSNPSAHRPTRSIRLQGTGHTWPLLRPALGIRPPRQAMPGLDRRVWHRRQGQSRPVCTTPQLLHRLSTLNRRRDTRGRYQRMESIVRRGLRRVLVRDGVWKGLQGRFGRVRVRPRIQGARTRVKRPWPVRAHLHPSGVSPTSCPASLSPAPRRMGKTIHTHRPLPLLAIPPALIDVEQL